jgi:toxin ParE1/3/4
MDYKIIWDDEAIHELSEAIRYIATDNQSAAEKTGRLIFQKIEILGSFPRFGKVFSKLNRDEVREIPIPPYRIIYHIKDAERAVRILKVWHAARREPEL